MLILRQEDMCMLATLMAVLSYNTPCGSAAKAVRINKYVIVELPISV